MTTFKLILGKRNYNSIPRISLSERIPLENLEQYNPECEYKVPRQVKNVFYTYEMNFSEDMETFLFKQMEEYSSISTIQIFCENDFFPILEEAYNFFSDCGFRLIEVFVNKEYCDYMISFSVNKKDDIYDTLE
ncbi:hypothetical protein H312_00931 [Anncaliia algerae PRA339]|uniref:Uncharacterized protein n=1 Tax=Anncaliia algerae PRA339 TaxID=1288291 RepID=A0A059F3F1_9MICR|nr:hypothetical protein H312_00931 [Anncaliia algerae PRA339]